MKADRADYPDSMQVRVNVKSVFEHKKPTIPHVNITVHCGKSHCQIYNTA